MTVGCLGLAVTLIVSSESLTKLGVFVLLIT